MGFLAAIGADIGAAADVGFAAADVGFAAADAGFAAADAGFAAADAGISAAEAGAITSGVDASLAGFADVGAAIDAGAVGAESAAAAAVGAEGLGGGVGVAGEAAIPGAEATAASVGGAAPAATGATALPAAGGVSSAVDALGGIPSGVFDAAGEPLATDISVTGGFAPEPANFGFSFDPATGNLTPITDSFSPTPADLAGGPAGSPNLDLGVTGQSGLTDPFNAQTFSPLSGGDQFLPSSQTFNVDLAPSAAQSADVGVAPATDTLTVADQSILGPANTPFAENGMFFNPATGNLEPVETSFLNQGVTGVDTFSAGQGLPAVEPSSIPATDVAGGVAPSAGTPSSAINALGGNAVDETITNDILTGVQGDAARALPGATGGVGDLFSMKNLPLAIGAAGLGVTLLRGEPSLPPQAQQAESQANQLNQMGLQNLATAQSGQITPQQAALIEINKEKSINQAYQMFAKMGRDPSQDSDYVQMVASINASALAQQEQFIQQMINTGLTETGQANSDLLAVAQMQMQSDTAFQQSLMAALSSFGLIAALSGITQKAA
jgi:hypothetical protein